LSVAKTIRGLCLLWLMLLVAAAGPAEAAEYFVSPAGSDAAPGSVEAPWRTLQHAVEQVGPGDVITVEAGVYAGCRIQVSGQPGAPITLRAAPGARVVIDRPGPDNRHGSNLELETWQGEGTVAWWVIQGLEVVDAPWAGIDLRGSRRAHSHHLTICDCLVRGAGRSGIFSAFVDHLRIENCTSRDNGEHGIYVSNSGDWPVLEGNTCQDNYACGIQINGDASMGGDGVISGAEIVDNLISGNGRGGGAGINLDGVVASLVRGNTLVDNLAGGIALYRTNGAVASQGNLILYNQVRMPLGARWALRLGESDCVGNQVLYNTLYHAGPTKGSIVIPDPRLTDLVSDHNRLTGRFSTDGGATVLGWEGWRAWGYDLNSHPVEETRQYRSSRRGLRP